MKEITDKSIVIRLILFILTIYSSLLYANGCEDAYGLILKNQTDPSIIAGKMVDKRLLSEQDVILDIGGEGRYQGAINLNPNPLTTTTGESGRFIPNWLPGSGGNIPIESRVVDIVYLENAPIQLKTMGEVLRIITPRGQIHLSHPSDYADQYLPALKEMFLDHKMLVESDSGITKIYILMR